MNDNEIEKKALEIYPEDRICQGDIDIDLNSDCREGYIKACKDYESLPRINGWVARDSSGNLYLHKEKPIQYNGLWFSDEYIKIQGDHYLTKMFPDLTWEDKPIYVDVIIRGYDTGRKTDSINSTMLLFTLWTKNRGI